ncbi:TLR adapter interacting with SLC15A4 on the lysosome-like [Rhinoderma darwinii]|uniref:TLR adapter interacting with SLC15A4 on the lysosome-like n=1 Tax=Rhinoderma darwinii TaxID=43563 RepID=UPI003F66900F
MLSESFLRTAIYRERMKSEERRDREEETPGARGAASGRTERGLEPLYRGDSAGASSQALCIPRREAPLVSPDLYTSWSSWYGSIYKNYPDLHIAGDHILHKVDSGCILDADCEDGPVLLSADIDSSSLPKENPGGLLEEGGAPSMESHTFPSAPFSNSVLNGFIEKKMQELYKQCYEENLNAAPHPLPWATIMHNVHQISLQISHEQSKATEAVLQGLCATIGGSSEFITPILHISGQDNKTRAGAPTSSSAFTKSGRAHSKK